MNLVINDSQVTRYYDLNSNTLLPSTYFPKKIHLSQNDLDAYEANGVLMSRTPGTYKYVCGLAPLPPKTTWNANQLGISYISSSGLYRPFNVVNRDVLDAIVSKYLKLARGKIIGVELSGGLDTSIIIETLRRNDIDVRLFGLVSSAYGFRTERAIQDIYRNTADHVICRSYDECPPFTNLTKSPVYLYPSTANLTYSRQKITVEAMKELEVEILLNGDAGDHLLCHSFEDLRSGESPEGYQRWRISDDWADLNVFKPAGITYISAFSLNAISRALWTMRRGQKEDYMKLWARRFFSDRLPYQLSDFAYKASHDGWFSSGIKKSLDDIYEVCKVAHANTDDPRLMPDNIIGLAKNYATDSHEQQLQFLTRLSFATWVHGLAREGYI